MKNNSNNNGLLMVGSMIALSAAAITGQVSSVEAAGDCPTSWKCYPMKTNSSSSITIDGDLTDWTTVEGISSPLMSILGTEYMNNALATYKCLYDSSRIYFAFDIPGIYKFNATDKAQCAAIATMTKMGVDATFVNMGGCPDQCGADGSIPSTCDSYRVDIGAHWELKTTQQGVAYNLEGTVTTLDEGDASANVTKSEFPLPLTGTGDDALANNDDEYAVNAFCRFDDNDSLASNEWGGAWMFSTTDGAQAAVDGDEGSYQFEIVRSLRTASDKTDAQMTAGNIYEFGIAFWDPNETSAGWTGAGHYVTGCALKWIDLELVADNEQSTMNAAGSTSDAFSVIAASTSTLFTVAGSILMGFLGFVMK